MKKEKLLTELQEFLRGEGRLPSFRGERKLYQRMYNSKDPEVRKFWKEHKGKRDTRPLLPLLQDFFRKEGRLPSKTKEPKLYNRMRESKDPEVMEFWEEHGKKKVDVRPLLPLLKEFLKEKGRLPSYREERNLYHRMRESKDPEVMEFWEKHGRIKNDTRPLLPTLKEFLREEGRLPSTTKESGLYQRMRTSKDPEVIKFWEEHRNMKDTRPLLPLLQNFFRKEGRLPSWSKEKNLYDRMIKSKDPEIIKFINLVKLLGLKT